MHKIRVAPTHYSIQYSTNSCGNQLVQVARLKNYPTRRIISTSGNEDLASMQALWSKGDHVCVVHPGASGISGHDLVMGSWEFVWAYDLPLEIEIEDVQVHVRGDVGYVTCIEMVKTKGSRWGRQFATNVFERIDGQWFMSIHHASYVDL